MAVTHADVNEVKIKLSSLNQEITHFENVLEALKKQETPKPVLRGFKRKLKRLSFRYGNVIFYLKSVTEFLDRAHKDKFFVTSYYFNYVKFNINKANIRLDELREFCRNNRIFSLITCLVTSAIAWCGTKTSPTQKFD